MSESVLAQAYDLLTESINPDEEATDMGSFNHSSIQANLAFSLSVWVITVSPST